MFRSSRTGKVVEWTPWPIPYRALPARGQPTIAVGNRCPRRACPALGTGLAPTVEEMSAGGVVVDTSDAELRVAIIARLNRGGRLEWCLPKGHPEDKENNEQAAVREIAEETGIEGASWPRWAASTTGSPSAGTGSTRPCTTTCCVPQAGNSPSRTIPTKRPWMWPGCPSGNSPGSSPSPMSAASPTSPAKSCPNISEPCRASPAQPRGGPVAEKQRPGETMNSMSATNFLPSAGRAGPASRGRRVSPKNLPPGNRPDQASRSQRNPLQRHHRRRHAGVPVPGLRQDLDLGTALGLGSTVNDTFINANNLPNLIFLLVAGGVFNAVLVPQIIKASKAPDGERTTSAGC